jgi:hypothetical protein
MAWANEEIAGLLREYVVSGCCLTSRCTPRETNQLIVSRTEEEVYARLGLAWVPPAMREDRGEIEAAAQGRIPSLVRENDLKGDLHTHTDLTDGVASLDAMVAAARRRGYAYYAITDHAPNLIMQRMTDEKMLAQREQVRTLDTELELLHGTELNIGPGGSVDWEAHPGRRDQHLAAGGAARFPPPGPLSSGTGHR